MTVTIRPECAVDYVAISDVISIGFGREAEANLVENLRQTTNYIPELALVAEEDDQIVGHILFTKAALETPNSRELILALAPLVVLPDHQGQGIGAHLVRHGLEACRGLGYAAVVVLGHAQYYPRFGFRPAIEKGINAPFQVPEDAFMVVELSPGFLEGLSGVVIFPTEFDGV